MRGATRCLVEIRVGEGLGLRHVERFTREPKWKRWAEESETGHLLVVQRLERFAFCGDNFFERLERLATFMPRISWTQSEHLIKLEPLVYKSI